MSEVRAAGLQYCKQLVRMGTRFKWLSLLAVVLLLWGCGEEDDCIDQSKIQEDAGCIEVYEPVCGCDGETYGNACKASIHGVKTWEEGPC